MRGLTWTRLKPRSCRFLRTLRFIQKHSWNLDICPFTPVSRSFTSFTCFFRFFQIFTPSHNQPRLTLSTAPVETSSQQTCLPKKDTSDVTLSSHFKSHSLTHHSISLSLFVDNATTDFTPSRLVWRSRHFSCFC
ncbi:hypothetical protein BLNAU_5474 [Blattamonas nauphoetae]|uniref:Uncharacterized protein n=1 Tax=Blattamonas nauphoetae TaxID=2049346 RepID=A0ABQ9Y6N3_9EUKA|nr:hypothetical protein BLNAU_5474 [Blattamonas nauphoetae]